MGRAAATMPMWSLSPMTTPVPKTPPDPRRHPATCPEANEVGDRAEAILRASMRWPGDALLIAGKGHETGQVIAGTVYPFDDVEQASIAVAALDGVI
jgi:hypothetical protein